MKDQKQYLLEILDANPVMRSKDLERYRISRNTLSRVVQAGLAVRTARGIYRQSGFNPDQNAGLVELTARSPQIIFCLFTALQFHELTTHSPDQVWVAIGNKARQPKIDYPPIRIVRYSDELLVTGVNQYQMDGVAVKITSIERTIVDCFKYRNKIGIDVALEALHDGWQKRRVNISLLGQMAASCRMTQVMRPYLESLNV